MSWGTLSMGLSSQPSRGGLIHMFKCFLGSRPYVCTTLSSGALLTQAMACETCIGGSTLNPLGDISECAGSCWFVHKLSFSSSIGTSLHILTHSRWSCCHTILWLRVKLKALTRMYFFLWQPHRYVISDNIHGWSNRSQLWIRKGFFAHCGEKAGCILLVFCFRGTSGTFWSISKSI